MEAIYQSKPRLSKIALIANKSSRREWVGQESYIIVVDEASEEEQK